MDRGRVVHLIEDAEEGLDRVRSVQQGQTWQRVSGQGLGLATYPREKDGRTIMRLSTQRRTTDRPDGGARSACTGQYFGVQVGNNGGLESDGRLVTQYLCSRHGRAWSMFFQIFRA